MGFIVTSEFKVSNKIPLKTNLYVGISNISITDDNMSENRKYFASCTYKVCYDQTTSADPFLVSNVRFEISKPNTRSDIPLILVNFIKSTVFPGQTFQDVDD